MLDRPEFARLAAARLRNQQICERSFDAPEDVVRWMGAIQAQDYLYSLWAVGLRTREARQSTIEQAINEGRIVRTWPMRGTIHYIPAEDAAWMVRLLSPRVIAGRRALDSRMGLDEQTVSKSRKLLVEALQGGRQLTRNQLYDEWERGGVRARARTSAGLLGLHLVTRFGMEGVLCFGPRQGKQDTFVLLEEWVASPRHPTEEEGLAELVIRYFQSHGPATAQDFAWWAGLTVGAAREAIESVGSALLQESVPGQTYWCVAHPPHGQSVEHDAHLLPYVDEFTVAYKDRSAIADPSRMKQIEAYGSSGILGPVVVAENQVVGVWRRTLAWNRVVVETTVFTDGLQTAIKVAVQCFGSFLGLPPSWVHRVVP